MIQRKLNPWKPDAPKEQYRPSVSTDIRETFERARAKQRKEKSRQEQKQ